MSAEAREGSLVHLSPEDEDRFGVRAARAPLLTAGDLGRVTEFCRRERVALLIARCLADEIRTAQRMEREGFFLTDTLIHYLRNLRRPPLPSPPAGTIVRTVRAHEEEKIRRVASEAFRDYRGHYQADDRLPRASAGEIYGDWAFRSCLERGERSEVLVAEEAGRAVGFIAVRLNTPEEGEGPLTGVVPGIPRRSLVQQALIIGSLRWARDHGAARFLGRPLIVNAVMQKILVRLGFEPGPAYYTFHKWFEPIIDR